jgi:hypothetical protein
MRAIVRFTTNQKTRMAAGMRPRDGHRYRIQLGANVPLRVVFRNVFAAAGNSTKGTDDRPSQWIYAKSC